MNLQEQIDQAAIRFRDSLGEPAAVKRGQFADRPYVAILKNYLGMRGRTCNPMGRAAYATREEAIGAVERYLGLEMENHRKRLADPRCRALRQQYGLPRELPASLD